MSNLSIIKQIRIISQVAMRLLVLLLAVLGSSSAQMLTPSQITISHRKPVTATSTCGELNGQTIRELYCSLTGSMSYSPLNPYSYQEDSGTEKTLQELRKPRDSLIDGGHGCDYCMAGSADEHPAKNMVDGNTSWWQSPPLSRGFIYNHVNITIDLEQEFHVSYVWITMANSPRPGTWILERSADYGKTYKPWFYFAENPADCMRKFGQESLSPIESDSDVICRTDFSALHPLENAEIMVSITENRPGGLSFTTQEELRNFTKATHVRLRLLGTRTLQGDLMQLSNARADPTVTRRYFYSIKEVLIGGRCVCNGHGGTCDNLDKNRPRALLCRCEHNTCGDRCETCCPGFEQKRWEPSTAVKNFTCEPCNCFGRSNECEFDEILNEKKQSLDIHGKYEGGGRCLRCRDFTEGINCNQCIKGFFRPKGVKWEDHMPCRPCSCDPNKHTGICAEYTGKCECQARFEGEDCDRCAKGYYDPPECKKCECAVYGTQDEICLPTDGQCPCKPGFAGTFCDTCLPGYTNVSNGCAACECDSVGSDNSICDVTTGQCVCKSGYSGLACERCQLGYYGYPNCTFCNCDFSGTEGGQCDEESGQCLCKEGFAGEKCDACDIGYYGYPKCKPCTCTGAGASSTECDSVTGQCPCYGNFTDRICDKCAAGFYDYPKCRACSCLVEGAKGQSCDNQGQCYCKGNFDGERCEKCKPNHYNFPACEECNCNPSGVSQDFAGCDKVAPGELCSCRRNVIGRICEQCKPTYWDLQYHHPDGCIGCDCFLNGTLSMLNSCEQTSGQCMCKRNAAGRRCDSCQEGFYNLQGYNQMACEPCNCDIGGSVRADCDVKTGKCNCRARVRGIRCDRPIENHYFPTLWHNQYEAEDGHTEDNRPVRFAVDQALFPDYSWRGYAVFSPIQEKIIMDIEITKASVYRLLFKYHNPTSVQNTATVTAAPRYTNTQDIEQSDDKVVFAPTTEPTIKEVTLSGKPFLLNPGKWAISVSTKQRLFLDYIVVLPAEYYQGSVLKQRATAPCEAHSTTNTTCIDLLYPPIPSTVRADVTEDKKTFSYVNPDGTTTDLIMVPVEILPEIIGPAAYVRAGPTKKIIEAKINVPETESYAVVLEYHNREKTDLPVLVDLSQDGNLKLNGTVIIHHCPYATFCRELVTEHGEIPFVTLNEGEAVVQLTVEPMHEFGLAAVNLVKKKDWKNEYLVQVPVCVRKQGECVPQQYPSAASSIVAEAESGSNDEHAVSADKLPFLVKTSKDVKVVPLDVNLPTLDISGVVPSRGHYIFLVHYFNPDSTPLELNAILQNDDTNSEGTLQFAYCPSVSGCRTKLRLKERPEQFQFWMEDKYTISVLQNSSQKGPIYIDSITAVPFTSYTENLLEPLPVDLSSQFVKLCAENFYRNDPSNVTEYCKNKIFSLTTDFNSAALSCDCIPQGSKSFACAEYGGQCECKANIIGRRCERCAPGYHSYPECIKCKCVSGQQCDERTGQCFCPPHVEGETCDRCVGYAFGYDPLIGCQPCGCNAQGSEGGSLQCDPNGGQCLCRETVGSRQCDRCLPGFYGFPHCYQCRCNKAGTTEDICDGTTAQCKCKANVVGPGCDQCAPGTFDLSSENPRGCDECFCFGVTDQCQSSYHPVSISSVDLSGFTTTDPSGNVKYSDDDVVYTASEEIPVNSVYFVAPVDEGKDYTNSYGLMLSVKLSVIPREGNLKMSSEADIRLHGNNMTAEFWAADQPVDPKKMFTLKARLVPENFVATNGKPLTREEMMMLLHSLKKITIKASFYESPASATLSEFGLEISGEELGHSVIRAASVEMCNCPTPYIGSSCQLCAPGYHRVPPTTGNLLGACVQCDCNGHSTTCDPDTGICSDCEHNTYGEHCEFCLSGHYGDATTGSPYACLPCACPHTENNFADSCVVSESGETQSCSCRDGYTGDLCDVCDAGFFGEPRRIGGACGLCNCNGNNDLTDPYACHPQYGVCDGCMNNTGGEHCEYCTNWYYGDAVTAKNCTACTCDTCGSQLCDRTNGECECKPNVEGDNCDRCAPDHFGFSRCQGCRACHCGIASSSGQCHAETGQCSCRPGAAGTRCEQCQHGFWNYGANGCEQCDCEADLSMGTVCDVRTGQCHCQEGATGSRCQMCLPSYLRIPKYGCRRCDECVHHLVKDVDVLDVEISVLDMAIGNISSASVVGARLSKNKKKMNNIADVSKLLDADEYNNFVGDARSVLTNMSSIQNSGKGMVDSARNDNTRIAKLIGGGEEILSGLRTDISRTMHIVQSVRQLTESIGSHSSLSVDPRHLKQAEERLMELESYSATPVAEQVENVPKKLDEVRAKIATFTDKLNQQNGTIESGKNKTLESLTYLTDAQKQLRIAKKHSEVFDQTSYDNKLFHLEGLHKAIVKDEGKFNQDKKDLEAIHLQIKNLTEIARDSRENIKIGQDTIGEKDGEIDEVMEHLNEEGLIEGLRKTTEEAKAYAKGLEDSSDALASTFGSSQLESQNAVDAATAYSNLKDALVNARVQADNAINIVSEENEGLEEMKSRVKSALEKSAEQLKKSNNLHKEVVNGLKRDVTSTDNKIERLTEQIATMGERRKNLQGNLKSPLKEGTEEDIQNKVDKVNSLKEDLQKTLTDIRKKVSTTQTSADLKVDEANKAAQGVKQSKNNIKELSALTPKVLEEFIKMKIKTGNNTAHLDSLAERMAHIKEMIAVARDAANRIKLGAQFEKGSSIDLNIPHRVARSAAHTEIAFHFRTDKDHGIPLFFGNEEGAAGSRAVPTDDYIAVEVEYGKPKITIDLGDKPLVIKMDTSVSDNQWRHITIERIGKTGTVTISKPNSEQVIETKTLEANGHKSVFNLHQTISKLFVGGIPQASKIAKDVRNRDFEGEIDDLQLHGEPVGLWNAKEKGMVNVKGAMKRPRDTDAVVDAGVSLNGEGFIVYNLQYWNPRKRTVFSLNFLTFSPDGLLFFVGKGSDFLSLELSSGSVKLSLDFGSGVGQWTSDNKQYNDGKWHKVEVFRDGRNVKLVVDDVTAGEGESPGAMEEMDVTEHFYLGGTPTGVVTRSPVEPLKGCLRAVRLDKDELNLQGSHASKGVRNSCPLGVVRTVSILSERSSATFRTLPAREDTEVTFKFKTRDPSGTLLSIRTDEEEVMRVTFDNGRLVVDSGEDKVSADLGVAADEQWHYVSVRRSKNVIRIDVDDLYSGDVVRMNGEELSTGEPTTIHFGRLDNSFFVGCIGDVTYNGKLLDFAKAERKEVSLTGCSLKDDEIKTTVSPNAEVTVPEKNDVQAQPTTTPTPKATRNPTKFKREGACSLPKVPIPDEPDVTGTRFGTESYSRLEYEGFPDALDKSSSFSLQLRASGASGVVFFVGSKAENDHIALFIRNGSLVFSFDTGAGKVQLVSNTSIMDNAWHSVKVARREDEAYLIVDEETVEKKVAAGGGDSIDVQPPFYVGGVEPSVGHTVQKVADVRPEFYGCIRDVRLNNKRFEDPKEVGTVACSETTEKGIFFGPEGGHAIWKKDFSLGQEFTMDIYVRPRTDEGVIFFLGSVSEYLTVQVMNNTVYFFISAPGGNATASSPFPSGYICDGHWHHIKFMRNRNLINLSFDSQTSLRVLKKFGPKGAKPAEGAFVKENFYLGGVPDHVISNGLKTRKPWIGCMRISYNPKKHNVKKVRIRKQLAADVEVYGDINRDTCPVY